MQNEAILHDYLNGALPGEALGPLDGALSASSALADELADLSRIDALLARHYGGGSSSEEITARLFAASPAGTGRTGRLAATAVVVLCGIVAAVIFWPRSERSASDTRVSAADSTAPAARRPVVRTSETTSRAASQRESEAQAAQLRQILSGFYLPAVDFKGVSLDQALAELEGLLQELDHLRRPELRSVRLRADKAARPSAPEHPASSITLRADNVTFLSVLRAIAAQSDHDFEMLGDTVVFSPRLAIPDDGNMIMRSYPVTREFFMHGGMSAGEGDPRPPAQGATDDSRMAAEILARTGVTFPPGASAQFDPTASTVTVRYPEIGIGFIDALLGNRGLLSSPQPQVRLSGQVIEWSGATLPPDQVMPREQFDEWLNQQGAQQTAAQSLAWPTAITFNGLTVGIDAVANAPAGGGLAHWQGTRILLLPVREGEVFRLGGILDISASTIAAPTTQPNDPNIPVTTPTQGIEFEALVADGQVAVVSFGGEGGSPPPIVAAFRVNAHSPAGEGGDRPPEAATQTNQ